MSDDSAIGRWVRLQRITWSVDAGAKAEKIAIEKDGDRIHEFPVVTPNLADVLRDAIDLQADELPQGAHSFRLIAYDEKGTQLSELHQTVRGRSKEATNAHHDLVTAARAAAMNVSNAASATALLRSELEREMSRNNDLVENQALLLDKIAEMQSANFDAQLRLETFHREQDRKDKFSEAMSQLLVPLGTLVIEKFGPKLLSMQPSEILEKAKSILGEPEGKTSNEPTTEPVDATLPVLHEPGQGAVSPSPEIGVTGNSGNDSAERGRKAPRAATTSKRKGAK